MNRDALMGMIDGSNLPAGHKPALYRNLELAYTRLIAERRSVVEAALRWAADDLHTEPDEDFIRRGLRAVLPELW